MQLLPLSAVRNWVRAPGKIPAAISTVCPHCAERGVFSMTHPHDDGMRKAVVATAACPGCSAPVHFWTMRGSSPDSEPAAIYMYPVPKSYYPHPAFAPDIPEALQRSFVSAIDALNSRNYAATAVCARRTLEGIFKYLVPETKRRSTLAALIDHVKGNVDLAAPLTTLSHAIRDGGNLGAHFDSDNEPTAELARQMIELLDYLIAYLYVLPGQIKRLEETLGKE
jgi:hypothetical protein